jgi:hypothetical protein
MTGMHHHTQLRWDGVLWTLSQGWTRTAILPIFTSLVARITGISHHTRFRVVFKSEFCGFFKGAHIMYYISALVGSGPVPISQTHIRIFISQWNVWIFTVSGMSQAYADSHIISGLPFLPSESWKKCLAFRSLWILQPWTVGCGLAFTTQHGPVVRQDSGDWLSWCYLWIYLSVLWCWVIYWICLCCRRSDTETNNPSAPFWNSWPTEPLSSVKQLSLPWFLTQQKRSRVSTEME